jgi:hypothetical protein
MLNMLNGSRQLWLEDPIPKTILSPRNPVKFESTHAIISVALGGIGDGSTENKRRGSLSFDKKRRGGYCRAFSNVVN